MRSFYFAAVLLVSSLPATAQTGPKPSAAPVRIAAARQELRSAFLADDPAAAGLWMDSLSRLEDDVYIGLVWDERWLLYLWEEAYGNMFDEVVRFDADRERQAYKIRPAADSLYETVDATLYERRFELFNRLQSAFLNEEEKAFIALQVDYLLRLNADTKDWTTRLDAFLGRYPASRFADYIRSIRPETPAVDAGNRGFGLSASFLKGEWSGPISQSLRPLYAFDASFYLWRRGWQIEINSLAGDPALGQRVAHHGLDWQKGDAAYFRTTGLVLGRDVLNKRRLRLTPSAGVYFASLSPKPPEGKDNPDYYSEFYFSELHVATALTADLKLFRREWKLEGVEKGAFHGLRLRAGCHWMRLGRQNGAFSGNLFYFALGYHFFIQRPSK